MNKPLWPWMLAAVLLALVPRLAIVLAPRADLLGPLIAGEPNVRIGEELTRGDIALELLEGPLLSLTDYQYADFFGGATVDGIVALPFFALLGPSLWALKLAAATFHLLALCVGMSLADRWISRRAALAFGLLFACTPPGYTLLSTIAWGCHVETGLLALGCTWLYLDLRDVPAAAPGRLLRRAALGALAGFSIYFNYECLIFLAALACFDAFVDRGLWRAKELAAQGAGALLGLLPWLVYNLRNDWAGLSVYGVSLSERLEAGRAADGLLARVAGAWTTALPGGFFFAGALGIDGRVWSTAAFAVLVALALLPALLARRATGRPWQIAWAYLAWYTLVFAQSGFTAGERPDDIRTWRYVMMPLPFLVLAAARGLDVLAARGRGPARAAAALALALAVLCGAGNFRSVDGARAFADAGTPGASHEHFGHWMAVRFGTRLDKLEELTRRAEALRSPEQQAEIFGGMAKALRNRSFLAPDAPPERVANAAAYAAGRAWMAGHAPAPYRSLFSDGAGG